jgi:hypothetical protein
MRMRDMARFVCSMAIAGATGVIAASCGGSGSTGGQSDGSVGDGPQLNFSEGGGNQCTPKTCADFPAGTCGAQGDGCGGATAVCGQTVDGGPLCPSGQYCGGGGPSLCGSMTYGADGAVVTPCVPKTCTDFPTGTCGPQADGCGGSTAVCGQTVDGGPLCPTGQFCGGGGPGLCGAGDTDGGDAGVCAPLTCADYPTGTCGQQSDGCGSTTANCGTCTQPAFCGGGTTPSTCGGNDGMLPDGGDAGLVGCVPATCASASLSGTCGPQSDGCGGMVGPCNTCAAPAFCGGGGPSLCGGDAGTGTSTRDGGDAGNGSCVPKTCASYPTGTCGQQSDGCGGLTANCGTCTNPAFCGGGGAGLCGGNDGKNPDGSPAPACTPKTSADCGSANCGVLADGCGGTFACGPAAGCQLPDVCGGGGTPNVCGSNVPCTGLCPQQQLCDGGSATLTGTVVAAPWVGTGATYGDPVPNVLVYIPNRTAAPYVDPFTPRAMEGPSQQCSTCGADVSGNPLVETNTNYMGVFTLTNVPVGSTIPVVIQLGRWRRVFTVSTACGSNTVNAAGMPAGYLLMPATSAQGDIPLTAISTGDVDAMECVLLKMGVDPSEFVAYSSGATGRIQLYQGNGATASAGGTTPPETTLMGTSSAADAGAAGGTYNDYDQVILPCWGIDPTTNNSLNAKSPAELANLVTYGNQGGHFFATHYSYAWLYNNNPYSTTANWEVNHNTNITSMTGVVSQSVPPTTPPTTPGVFVQWLNYIGALSPSSGTATPPNPADVTIANARHDVNSVVSPSVEWIDGTDPGDQSAMLLHYTFDTPVGSTSQCGHAIFSDFHVTNSATGPDNHCTQNSTCPSGTCNFYGASCTQNSDCGPQGTCSTHRTGNTCSEGTCAAYEFPSQSTSYCGTTMTAQEKILEYMIWDLAQCVPAPPVSTCTNKTCADYPAGTCGPQSNGCGGVTPDCSPCTGGQTCGGCGTPGVCCTPDGSAGTCTPKTCADYPNQCGQQPDGCGGLTANCTCAAPATCGGSGSAGICGIPSDGGGGNGCTKLTCAAYPAGTCGQQADGCGGLTADCNPCPMGQTCGGCGTPGQCCTPPTTSCTPQGCPAGQQCGFASNGCGGIATCGTCTPPQTCGGGGTANVCGGNSGCVPITCADQGVTCGPAGDGCGNLIPGGCGPCPTSDAAGSCVPKTCAALGINCGPAADGCGNLIPSCGTCIAPETCGGGGKPGVCGSPVAQ